MTFISDKLRNWREWQVVSGSVRWWFMQPATQQKPPKWMRNICKKMLRRYIKNACGSFNLNKLWWSRSCFLKSRKKEKNFEIVLHKLKVSPKFYKTTQKLCKQWKHKIIKCVVMWIIILIDDLTSEYPHYGNQYVKHEVLTFTLNLNWNLCK